MVYSCVKKPRENVAKMGSITNTQLNKKRIAHRGFALIKVLELAILFPRAPERNIVEVEKKERSKPVILAFALCDFSVHSTRKEKHYLTCCPICKDRHPNEAAEAKFSTWPTA